MKKSLRKLHTAIAVCFCVTGNLFTTGNQISTDHTMDKDLSLIREWDRVFPQSDKVNYSKVTFHDRYGTTFAVDMYKPEHADGKLPTIAVSGPPSAVKEQSSGLYARKLAGHGLPTTVFDPSYTGEGGGEPRYIASPDINMEDFCAVVDFLSTHNDVGAGHISIIGICGWGGMVLNAAVIDTRIEATVTSMIYDINRVSANGYFDAIDINVHYELRKQLNEQRTTDTENGSYALAGGLPDMLPDDVPQFLKDCYAYYKTKHDYHKRSPDSNGGWNKTSALSLINVPILSYSDETRGVVLIIYGGETHLCYFSEDASKKPRGDNKESLIIPGTNHIDLYDQTSVTPFDEIERFFVENFK